MERVNISKTNDGLTLTKSKSFYSRQLIRIIVGIVLWCVIWYVILTFAQLSGIEAILMWLLILLLPLFLLPKLYNYISVTSEGEVFVFDRNSNHLLNNGVFVTPVSDITYLQVYAHIARGPYEYSLFAVLENGQKIQIDRTVSAKEIYELAEEIARFLGVKILNKDRFTPDNQMKEHIFEGYINDQDAGLLTLEEVKTRIEQQPSRRFPLKIVIFFGSIVGVVLYFFHWFNSLKRQT